MYLLKSFHSQGEEERHPIPCFELDTLILWKNEDTDLLKDSTNHPAASHERSDVELGKTKFWMRI
jgi:hypothetical protein